MDYIKQTISSKQLTGALIVILCIIVVSVLSLKATASHHDLANLERYIQKNCPTLQSDYDMLVENGPVAIYVMDNLGSACMQIEEVEAPIKRYKYY